MSGTDGTTGADDAAPAPIGGLIAIAGDPWALVCEGDVCVIPATQ